MSTGQGLIHGLPVSNVLTGTFCKTTLGRETASRSQDCSQPVEELLSVTDRVIIRARTPEDN